MAQSPSHKFGQIIGDVLEAAIAPLLQEFALKHGLYLDGKGKRTARKGTKVAWVDLFGNSHDLDHVLERGGTDAEVGVPVAFIETAWRRYTKHSRNKAQEIQGAILPLVSTHSHAAPFIGVVLAGEFTGGALDQLRSQGFTVLYFPYSMIIEAFKSVGIDALYDETTPDRGFLQRVKKWAKLASIEKSKVAKRLLTLGDAEVNEFLVCLEHAVLRQIERVLILPLHGESIDCDSVESAIATIMGYSEVSKSPIAIIRYEVEIRYSNGHHVKATFDDKQSSINFLRPFLPPPIKPVS